MLPEKFPNALPCITFPADVLMLRPRADGAVEVWLDDGRCAIIYQLPGQREEGPR